MATRTAPTVDGTGNIRMISLRLIDVSGDKRAVAVEAGIAEVAADIEAFAAAYAAITNASLYAIHDSMIYNSPAVAANATAAEENSVYDNIVMLAKGNTNQSEDLFLVAPERGNFVGDTDNPDQDSVGLIALGAAWEAITTGTKIVVSVRYTERREKNQALPFASS